jgi:hypothetical protein
LSGSGFGHVLFFSGEATGIRIEECVIEGKTRSTDDLRDNGIDGYDRNGVPFNIQFNREEYGAAVRNGNEYSMVSDFKPLPGTDACQNMDGGTQIDHFRRGYQFSSTEGGLRSYGNNIEVTVINSEIRGVREGLSLDSSRWASAMIGVSFRGLAGHGVPACAGGWNSGTPDNDSPAIRPASDSTITRCGADSPFSVLALAISRNNRNVLVDFLETLDPDDGRYARPEGEALAMIDGRDHFVRLEKKNGQALKMALKVKVGCKGVTSNLLLLCNLSAQPVELCTAVINSVVISVGPVTNGGSGNMVVQLNDNGEEPDICKEVKRGKRPSEIGHFLMYNAKVHMSGSKNASPANAATMISDSQQLEVGSGGSEMSTFMVRHEPSTGSRSSECVHWNDKMWLAWSTKSANTRNCGWYGCRVARMKSRIMVFDHGRLGQPFIVRPKGGSYSTGSCVSYGDEVFLAVSTQSYNTKNCG